MDRRSTVREKFSLSGGDHFTRQNNSPTLCYNVFWCIGLTCSVPLDRFFYQAFKWASELCASLLLGSINAWKKKHFTLHTWISVYREFLFPACTRIKQHLEHEPNIYTWRPVFFRTNCAARRKSIKSVLYQWTFRIEISASEHNLSLFQPSLPFNISSKRFTSLITYLTTKNRLSAGILRNVIFTIIKNCGSVSPRKCRYCTIKYVTNGINEILNFVNRPVL